MQATVSSRQPSYRVDQSPRPRRAPEGHSLTQEEFEAVHARRALYRALGEASPVIAVLVVILVFSIIP